MSKIPNLSTFPQFSARHRAFPESAVRWLRFNREENGFEGAFVKVGRRVYVDEDAFFDAVMAQNDHKRVDHQEA